VDGADRQSQGEAAAAPMHAVCGQVAAHGNGQFVRDRQAQPAAATSLALLALLEWPEQKRQLSGRNADAAVDHIQQQLPGRQGGR